MTLAGSRMPSSGVSPHSPAVGLRPRPPWLAWTWPRMTAARLPLNRTQSRSSLALRGSSRPTRSAGEAV
jgi:hypothetical protein